MPSKKISELTEALTLDGTEIVPVVQDGTTKKATVDALRGLSDLAKELLDDPDAATMRDTLGIAPAMETIWSYPANARKWAAALASRTTSSPARLVWLGDSVTEGLYGSPVDKVRRRLARFNGGRVGPGWVNAAPDSSLITGGVNTLNALKFRLTTGSYNSGGLNIVEEAGLGLFSFLLAPGSVLTLSDAANASTTARFSRAEFHFAAVSIDSLVGTAEIRIDGTLVQTIDGYDATVNGGQSGHTYTWSGTEADHTITITGAGAAAFWFEGVYLALNDETVYVYNAGNSGEKYADLLTVPSGHEEPPAIEAAREVDADAVLLAYGINDYSDGTTTLATNVAAAITALRSEVDDATLGIVIPYATASRTDWADFATATAVTAELADVPVCDLSFMLETNASTTDPHGLVTADNVHLDASGGELWADRIAEFVIGDSIDWVAVVTAMAARLVGGERLGSFLSAAASSFDPGVRIAKFGTAGANALQFTHARGTAAAPTATQSGDVLGRVVAVGYGATGLISSGLNLGRTGYVGFRAAENFTDSAAGTDVVIGGTPTGSITQQDNVVVKGGGGMQLQGAATVYSGSGAPDNAVGSNGDLYIRTGTPGTANQRLYMKASGAWAGII